MDLEQKVMTMLKEAMKSKDEASLRALRAIKGAIIVAKTEKQGVEITEDKELDLLQKLAKQRKESIDVFEKQNMSDLAIKEKEELEVIETFLPVQLTEEEIKPIVEKIIKEQNATEMKDMGKVIGIASAQLKGQADGSIISKIAKTILTS